MREEFSKRLKLACCWEQAKIILYLGNYLNLHFSGGVSKSFLERVGSMISCFCNFAVLYSCLKVEERSEVVGASFLWRSTVGCLLVGHPFATAFLVKLLLKSQYVFVGFSFLKKKSSVALQVTKCSKSLLSWHLGSTACTCAAQSGQAFSRWWSDFIFSLSHAKPCSELSGGK